MSLTLGNVCGQGHGRTLPQYKLPSPVPQVQHMMGVKITRKCACSYSWHMPKYCHALVTL